MLQELLPLLPQEAGRLALVVAIVGTAVGIGLWLAGSRVSRALVTLIAVALGAVIGRQLPTWMGWSVDRMGTTVAGAVVLGLSGYLLHRAWIAAALGGLLACWAALGTWVLWHDGASWHWPAIEAGVTAKSFAQSLWASLPSDVQRILPFSTGVAFISGVAMELLWPKFSTVTLYSSAGASLIVGMGLATLEYGRPEWLAHLPSQTWAQLLVLGALVAFGAIVQWQLAPAGGGKPQGDGD